MALDEIVAAALSQLVDEIDADLSTIAVIHGAVAAKHRELGESSPDEPLRAWFAYKTDRYYSAIESSFERIARVLDHSLPTGSDWHKELLRQMTRPVPSARDAVISGELATRLDVLLRFRHVLRHAYRAELDWAKQAEVVEALLLAHEGASEALCRVRDFAVLCLGSEA